MNIIMEEKDIQDNKGLEVMIEGSEEKDKLADENGLLQEPIQGDKREEIQQKVQKQNIIDTEKSKNNQVEHLDMNNDQIIIQRKVKKSFTTFKSKPETYQQQKNMTNYLLPRLIIAPKSQSSQKENSYYNNNNDKNNKRVNGGMLRSRSNYSLYKSQSNERMRTNESCLMKQSSIRRDDNHHHKTMVENYSFMNGKKVYMSSEDVAKLKKLKLQYQRRQQKIHSKIQQHQRELQEMKLQQKRQQQQKIQKQRQQRVRLVQQRQQQRSIKRLHKLSQQKQQNKRLKQIKSKKKLYQKMQNSFFIKQKQQKQQKQQIVKKQKSKKKLRVDYDEIKQSARHYKKSRSLRIEQSREKLRSSLQNLKQQFDNMHVYRSRFYSQVKKQNKNMKQSRLLTQHKPIQYKKRIQQYENKVKQKHLPKTNNKLKLQLKETKKQQRKVYGQKEIRQMGNRNMRLVLNNVAKSKVQKQNQNKDDNNNNNKKNLLIKTVDNHLSVISASKDAQQKYQHLKTLKQHLSKQFSRKQSLKHTSKQYVNKEIEQIGVKMRVVEGLVGQ